MTPEQKQLLQQAEDLTRFASEEAAKRIIDIASVLDDDQVTIMIGMKTSRALVVSFLMTAIRTGMPHEAAESFARSIIDGINDQIAQAAKERADA